MTNDEVIDTLEYFKLHFANTGKARECFDKAIEIIEAESNRKASIAEAVNKIWNSPSTVSIESIKSCPHLLPCGFCDKREEPCSQYK